MKGYAMQIINTFAKIHSPKHGATPVTLLAVLMSMDSNNSEADNALTVLVGTFSLGDFKADRAGYIQRGLAAFEHVADHGVKQTLASARLYFPFLSETEYRI